MCTCDLLPYPVVGTRSVNEICESCQEDYTAWCSSIIETEAAHERRRRAAFARKRAQREEIAREAAANAAYYRSMGEIA